MPPAAEEPARAPADQPSPAPPRRRWGRWLLLGVVFVLMLLAGAAGAGWWYLDRWGDTPHGPPAEHAFSIAPGTSARAIAGQLHARGLVSHPDLYLLWLKREKKLASLHAGDYTLRAPLSPRELTDRLGRGSFQRRLTIPEGWTARRIGARLAREQWVPSEQAWLELLTRPGELPAEFVSVTGIEPTTGTLPPLIADAPATQALALEGFLFPDTYVLESGTPPRAVLHALLNQFVREWRAARPDDRAEPARELTPRQLVTLASLIEREARADAEMPLIASVYYNRLARRMRLQCDATVHYALGDVWDRPLTFADLKVESPYNTYVHYGLPPGPIANPGRPALEAALRPAETDYLYYVYAGGEQHVFTETYRDHQRAVREARKREE